MQPPGPPGPPVPPSGAPGDSTVFYDVSQAPGGPGPRRSRTPLLVAVVVALVLVLGAVGTGIALHASGGGGSSPAPVAAPLSTSPSGSTAAVAACTTPPTITTRSAQAGQSGLTVTVQATSSCQGGQLLEQRGTTVTLTDGAATVAQGTVDFAATPVRVGGSGSSTLTLAFPTGSYWIVPSSSSAAGTTVALREPSAATASSATATPSTPSSIRVTAGGVTPQQAQSYATAALRRQADIDKPDVLARLAEQWEPQLSSKRSGLVADGITYDDQAVLADHLAFRARYPQARLLYSGEWQNFSRTDFWVTVSGTATAGPDSSLSWCAAQGLDRDHCLATFVSTRVGPDGTSKLQ